MQKADLLDELRAEIGMMSDREPIDFPTFYQFVCSTIKKNMEDYSSVSIYQTERGKFYREYHAGESLYPLNVALGDDLLTVSGMRGEMVWEKIENHHYLAFPFYRGHHLVGSLMVIVPEENKLEEEEILFLGELINLFESKENNKKKEQ